MKALEEVIAYCKGLDNAYPVGPRKGAVQRTLSFLERVKKEGMAFSCVFPVWLNEQESALTIALSFFPTKSGIHYSSAFTCLRESLSVLQDIARFAELNFSTVKEVL